MGLLKRNAIVSELWAKLSAQTRTEILSRMKQNCITAPVPRDCHPCPWGISRFIPSPFLKKFTLQLFYKKLRKLKLMNSFSLLNTSFSQTRMWCKLSPFEYYYASDLIRIMKPGSVYLLTHD